MGKMGKHADGRQDQRIQAYTKFWQKDLNDEEDNDTERRLENYADVINGKPPCSTCCLNFPLTLF